MGKYFMFGIVMLIALPFLQWVMKFISTKKVTRFIHRILNELNRPYHMTQPKSKAVDWVICIDHHVFLIKLFSVNQDVKLVITNLTTWIKTKKSNPIKIENRIIGTQAFIHQQPDHTDQVIHKIALLYPGVEQIRQYINENEMNVIELNTLINTYRFMTLDSLKDGMNHILDQK
jgi:hypothetical protein